jgi:uncharacterized protein
MADGTSEHDRAGVAMEKLVRNGVADLVGSGPGASVLRVASGQEYRRALRAKLVEEVDEFLAAGSLAELADVSEVVLAIADELGAGAAGLESARMAKRSARGGFDRRYLWSSPQPDTDVPSLADWRTRVAALYLSDVDLTGFRAGRDALFATHPQSPIPSAARAGFSGLRYFPADDRYVVRAPLRPAHDVLAIDTGGPDGIVRYRAVGRLDTAYGSLVLWWIEAYGGGLFLPFRDGTCGRESYGGGRYLTDTVKGTFGRGVTVLSRDEVQLDFNYAYNPSCAYDDAWACPLAPRENWLDAGIRAGELAYLSSS